MLFNSYIFIFAFLPITFVVYYALNYKNMTLAANAFLAGASLFFYSWWNIAYLPLILSSVLFNFFIGRRVGDRERISFGFLSAKGVLTIGIIAIIWAVKWLSQPWRGIIDAGVLVGLTWGLITVLISTQQAFSDTPTQPFPYAPEVPDDAP